MPAKAKVKSFNGTDWREVALRLLVVAVIAVVIVLLAAVFSILRHPIHADRSVPAEGSRN